jgi:predicted CXXCH cytochrome family protein
MKKTVILSFVVIIIAAGCARSWIYQPLETYKPTEAAPPASVCQPCHQAQFDSWKKTRHSEPERMAKISVPELRECGACHEGLAAHAADSAKTPPAIGKMTKTDRNTLCGKCHYNPKLFGQKIFGSSAINPHDRHALFADVGLEGWKKQIACLDCHSGHKGGTDMLVRIRAHICYECHTSAMVTMGILFQIPNWLTAGYTCRLCHTFHGGSATERWGWMGAGVCIVCHFAGVALVGD